MQSIETQEIIDNFKENEKETVKFNTNTPEGNNIQGRILLKRNSYFGSLIIRKVNGEEAYQVIHGMPKINYYNGHNDLICTDTDNIVVHEKLDGSNLLIYPLKDSEGNIIEVVAKTRKTPVATKELYKLYCKVPEKETIEDHIKETGDILIFELYGKENKHEIEYDEDIAVGLLRGYNKCNKPLDTNQIRNLKDKLGITSPRMMQLIWKCDSFKEVYNRLINELNNTFTEELEGYILSGIDSNYQFQQLKVKTKKFYEKHTYSYGVPSLIIQKEVYKLFDEYYITLDNLKEHLPEYVLEVSVNLEEEADPRYVRQKSTCEKIEDNIVKAVAKRENKTLRRILEDIYKENSESTVQDMLRVFAEKYPFLKKYSREAFQTLTVLKKTNGIHRHAVGANARGRFSSNLGGVTMSSMEASR